MLLMRKDGPGYFKFGFYLALVLALLLPSIGGAEETHPKDETPDIVVGLMTGFVDHYGKTVEVDGTSGASAQVDDSEYHHLGGTAGVYVDAGLLKLGRGDLGLALSFWTSFPDIYFDLGILPRYRLTFDTESSAITRVEPWIGIPLFFTFAEKFSSDFYFMLGVSIGCDLSLGESNWVLGLGIHVNAVNVRPVRNELELYNESHEYEYRMDSLFLVLNLGYRLL